MHKAHKILDRHRTRFFSTLNYRSILILNVFYVHVINMSLKLSYISLLVVNYYHDPCHDMKSHAPISNATMNLQHLVRRFAPAFCTCLEISLLHSLSFVLFAGTHKRPLLDLKKNNFSLSSAWRKLIYFWRRGGLKIRPNFVISNVCANAPVTYRL